MQSNAVRITLDLRAKVRDVWPTVVVGIDQHRFHMPTLSELQAPVILELSLAPGTHQLWIDVGDAQAFDQDPEMAIIVESVKFQHLADEFRTSSEYRPQYPEHWIQENQDAGQTLAPVIHSNYLGWPGRWWIDFETPVYAWLHRKLNLGWLI